MQWVQALFVLTLISVAGASACTRHNPAACCTSVEDCNQVGLNQIGGCAADQVCNQGTCTAPECVASSDCSMSGDICSDGLCVVGPDANIRVDYIAFVSTRDGNNEIYRMKADGSEQINLTHDASSDTAPLWDPTGDKISFLSDRGGIQQLYVMRFDGTGLVNVSQGQASDPVWSPNGATLAFVSTRAGGTNIFAVPAAGGTVAPLTTTGTAAMPDWSHDGSHIAYFGNSALQVMDSNGFNSKLAVAAFAMFPKWSPDGKRFAFVHRNFDIGGDDVYLAKSDGTGTITTATMTAMITESRQQWSPSGLTLLGQTDKGEIFLLQSNTLAYTNLTMSAGLDESPSWVPDGTRYVWASDATGDLDIYVAPLAGGTPTNLTKTPLFTDTDPVWRPGA